MIDGLMMMMMFIGTETLVTQLVNERSLKSFVLKNREATQTGKCHRKANLK